MMFQRRPFISQREKTLALRDTASRAIVATVKRPARHRLKKPGAFGLPGNPKEMERWQYDIR
jgi:hypothetical protein